MDDLLEFLAHASARGLMPAATAQSLAVACRNVFGVLDEAEQLSLPIANLDGVIKRFTNKRAKDFNPTSLKEYDRRVRRSVALYLRWRESPADFSVKTRVTNSARNKEQAVRAESTAVAEPMPGDGAMPTLRGAAGYTSAFPIRPGHVVTIGNVPYDLTSAEAERFAHFMTMLAPG